MPGADSRSGKPDCVSESILGWPTPGARVPGWDSFSTNARTAPGCGPSPTVAADSSVTKGSPDGEYMRFESNFQRFQAQELMKRHTPGYFTRQGFLCQLMAAAGHRKSASQLREMADRVGRDRILIIHGTRDRMIAVTNGEKLIKMVKPVVGLIVDGMGHAPIMDRSKWFNALIEDRLAVCTKMDS